MTADHAADVASMTSAGAAATHASVLLHSDDSTTREQVRRAVGRRASLDTPSVTWTEAATHAAVETYAKSARFDLIVLDGEAAKVGGLAICRQLKNQVFNCPPILVLIARPQDAWLASWSEADAVVSQPLRPRELADAVAQLLRRGRADS